MEKFKPSGVEKRKENKIYAQKENKTNWLPVEFKPIALPKLSIRVGKAVIEIEKDYDENEVSRPREFHHQTLSEPDVNLSPHPAPIN